MKKLLVAIVALASVSVFADHHNMVRMYGWDAGNRASTFDVSLSNDDADEKGESQRIALNYARAFGQYQVGITYVSDSSTDTGSADSKQSGTTTGLSFYYNMEEDIKNTCYLALHYNMHASSSDTGKTWNFGGSQELGEDDTATSIILEYGHRWAVGSAWGLNLTYAPSVMYNMTSYDWDVAANDDSKGKSHNSLAWNFLKFDVLF